MLVVLMMRYKVLEVFSLSSFEFICCPLIGPSVQTHSRCFFRLPATGVSGHESLSESDSRLSPVLGERDSEDLRLGFVDLSETA